MSLTKLQLAQQKLLASDIPLQLRITYYLRISCTVLANRGIHYAALLQTLSHYNPNWLNTCTVSQEGLLESSDRTIDQFLEPFRELHQTPLTAIAPLPIAA